MINFINDFKEKLLLPLPGQEAQLKMAHASRKIKLITPDNARPSGVMVLLFLHQGSWHTLLMQRTEDGHTHSGQISFPGGKKDLTDADITETALRECEEEIGIPRSEIQLLGTLTPLYIPPSNFLVTPTVGFINFDEAHINISPNEVKEIYKVPLSYLFTESSKQIRQIQTNYLSDIEAYAYILPNDKIVWGATAMILSELEHLVKDLIFE